MYATPEFREWLNTTVKTAEPFYADNIAPRHQAFDLLKSFIVGKPFIGNRLFKRMRPNEQDIYELRTKDLRFFGWFPVMDCFVAVSGDLFERLKNDQSLYEEHRINCHTYREKLDLDEPKYIPGAGERGVISC